MQKASDIGAVHDDAAPCQFQAQLIQRQLAILVQTPTHPIAMRIELATAHMTLPPSDPVSLFRITRLFTKRGDTRKCRAASRRL
jgi:hypothetical protein